MYNDFSSTVGYDDRNRLSSESYVLNYSSNNGVSLSRNSYQYHYDLKGNVGSVRASSQSTLGEISYGYDDYGMLTRVENVQRLSTDTTQAFKNTVHYLYKDDEDRIYGLVETYLTSINDGTFNSYSYKYDSRGFISEISSSASGKSIKYTYDATGKLIREDNEELGVTYVYEYDDAGNITSCKTYLYTYPWVETEKRNLLSIETYSYTHSSLGDLLTAYNGAPITYDEMGNPLTYINGNNLYEFIWNGRELEGVYVSGKNISFTYNDEGIRTSKTVNGVTTTYYIQGSQIIAEETNGNMTLYVYDGSGGVIGMQYHAANASEDEWEIYWFEKNLQGDIIAVYNHSGEKLVSYLYDAWGNFTTTYHNGGNNTVIVNNPFTYRGYYYDYELGFYYLNSRYYSPELCRFISPDSVNYLEPTSISGLNLYAYCGNDPVNYIDPTGHSAILIGLIIGAIVGAGIGFGTVAYTDYQDDRQIFNGSVKCYEYVGGTVTGAILGAGVGGIINTGGAILTSAMSSVTNKFISDLYAYTLTGTSFGTWEDYSVAFISGGLIKGLGMKGIVKTTYDVALRPAINQVVKISTNRTETFNVEKYAYDAVTRGLTAFAPSPWKAFYRGGFRSLWDLYRQGYFA